VHYLWRIDCGRAFLFEAPSRQTRANEEKNGSNEACERSAQLQAGGNEIDPEAAFEEVNGIDFIEP
jgi:hypothetical protein